MSKPTTTTENAPGSPEWFLQHDNKEFLHKGKPWLIRARTFLGIYPYRHFKITVTAEMVDKSDPEYVESRAKLRGDWVSDLLESEELRDSAVKYFNKKG